MVVIFDDYVLEYFIVQVVDLDWWFEWLSCYGLLFLGEEMIVFYGDKVVGMNYVLLILGVVSYMGGLSVYKFMKIVIW